MSSIATQDVLDVRVSCVIAEWSASQPDLYSTTSQAYRISSSRPQILQSKLLSKRLRQFLRRHQHPTRNPTFPSLRFSPGGCQEGDRCSKNGPHIVDAVYVGSKTMFEKRRTCPFICPRVCTARIDMHITSCVVSLEKSTLGRRACVSAVPMRQESQLRMLREE